MLPHTLLPLLTGGSTTSRQIALLKITCSPSAEEKSDEHCQSDTHRRLHHLDRLDCTRRQKQPQRDEHRTTKRDTRRTPPTATTPVHNADYRQYPPGDLRTIKTIRYRARRRNRSCRSAFQLAHLRRIPIGIMRPALRRAQDLTSLIDPFSRNPSRVPHFGGFSSRHLDVAANRAPASANGSEHHDRPAAE